MHIKGAKDCHFWDASGKKYLDLSSQVICSTLGHQNEAVTEALVKQAKELAFIGPGFATDCRAELCSKLLEVMPPGMDKFFFPTAGCLANEAAIKVARFYTGKWKILTRYESYHGATATTLALTSDYRRYNAEDNRLTNNDGIIYIPEYNPYRPGPLGTTAEKHIEYIEYVLAHEPNVAAIILEPIVGSNGVLIPPETYWPELRRITKKYNVLLISDEVMAAWGRAGEWFAVDKWKVVPDIITTAKGITNSVTPLGMVATTREIANFFEDHWFCHGHTFESHPMTLAPAIAAIGEYQRLNLIERSRKMGAVFGEKLKGLMKNHPSVGDVRGTGFFWCVDLVKNHKTKERFATNVSKSRGASTPVDLVAADMMSRGVYVITHVNHFTVAPPLIITEQEMDFAIDAFDQALKITDALVVDK